MSPPKLPKKLKQARMAWKTFTTKIHSNLQKFHIPISIKAVSRRFLQFCSLRLYTPLKKRFLARSSSFRYYHHHHHHHHLQHQNKSYNNFKAVFIDRLYADQGASSSAEGGISYRKNHQRRKEEELKVENGDYTIEDTWKHVVASSPHLRGVDERAEEFIYKFKKEMKLAKEKSLLEFQERLARSA